MKTIFINNTWYNGEGSSLSLINPATGELSATLQESSVKQAEAAIQAAVAAFDSWRKTPLEKRMALLQAYAKALEAHEEKLILLLSEETGKPLWEAKTEVKSAMAKIAISIEAYEKRTGFFSISQGNNAVYYQHRPHGALLVLGPYNFPLHLPNGHFVPALLAGNTVIFKPSEYTPRIALLIAKLIETVGFPKGVFNVVVGGRDIGEKLLQVEKIQGVLFTGSYAVGKKIHQRFAGYVDKIVALEMGGNNPLIVWDVENDEAVSRHIILSSYITAGQRCSCARRLIIPDNRMGDAIITNLIDKLACLRVGAPTDIPEPFMGPVISHKAAYQLLEIETNLQHQGGKVLKKMCSLRENTGLLSPGLMDVSEISTLPDTEYFGPFLQVIRVKDVDAALDVANRTAYGLTAGLLSDNADLFNIFYENLNAGLINFNRPLTGANSRAPFGGIGHSGNHRPSAFYAADYCASPVVSSISPVLELPELAIGGLKS